ncbi:uncharacterized protein EURHEDRAFT_410240 [Aspergillus ruber CBS 135680]|uniref:Uncharacterized protein n=1 Tax=Aspergillus ruber (strain CBS 135680) TaxID=1388766 RepID=A0A017SKA7_ASPRC|nr:uncharacterized protein EURHEDRAFT_410240 [Aspergillus ruber CBS 135680]EYE97201.1 hypothetical protein EURHEDRAFT_410240 [Aspergillus ruber CBS 135680]
MDSFQCRYGIYGIYTTTWFLKRVGHYHFILPRAYGASLKASLSDCEDDIVTREIGPSRNKTRNKRNNNERISNLNNRFQAA